MVYTASEEALLSFYKRHKNIQSLDEVKLIYGMRLFWMDFKKLVIIYFFAFMLGISIELLFVQLGFIVFRQVAFGLHLGGFWSCLIASSLIFLGGAYLLSKLYISSDIILVTFFMCVFILTLLAPISSVKIKIKGLSHRRYLRRKMYTRFLVMLIAVIFLPQYIFKFLVLGMLIETLVICYSHVIFKRGQLECIKKYC